MHSMIGMDTNPVNPVSTVASNSWAEVGKAPATVTRITGLPELPVEPIVVGDVKKMLISAAEVMRERGAAGVTIDAVLARSGAPRGSVYHHFPEGRNQILVEALRYAGDSITEIIDDAADRAPRSWCASSSSTGTPAVRRRLQCRVPRRRRRARVGRRANPNSGLRRRRHPGPLVYRVDPRVRLRWLQRGGCGVAFGDVDRGPGGRHHAVPLDPQRRPAASGR